MGKVLIFILSLCSFVAHSTNFNDNDLDYLLDNEECGFIYIWSPYMPMSLMGRPEAQQIADDYSLKYIEVLDPLAAHNKDDNQIVFSSKRLLKKGVLNHFPSVVFFCEGEILHPIVQGYMNTGYFKNTIERLFK